MPNEPKYEEVELTNNIKAKYNKDEILLRFDRKKPDFGQNPEIVGCSVAELEDDLSIHLIIYEPGRKAKKPKKK